MVFEINGALPGLAFVGTCNKCKTVYNVSHIIRKGKKLYYSNTSENSHLICFGQLAA